MAELNGLNVYAADVGNAYLEALTNKYVCFIANSGFGDRDGPMMIIRKALYGLKISGK